MRIKTNLREMKDARADFVSLVERGANRTAFRIVKSVKEKEMLDLSKLGAAIKGAVGKTTEPAKKDEPTIVGLVVLKGEAAEFEAITKAVAALGFKTDAIKDCGDDAVMFVQEEEAIKDAASVRVGDHLMAVVKGFDPYGQELRNSGDFDETLKVDGFYNSIWTAATVLQSTVSTTLSKAESQEAAKTKVTEICEKFSNYVTTLVAGLPSSAFKLETAIKVAKDEHLAALKAKKDAMTDDEKAKELEYKYKNKGKPEEEDDPAQKGAKPAELTVAEAVAKAITEAMAPVDKAVAALGAAVKAVDEKITAQDDKIKAVAAKAESVEQTVKSTVAAPSGNGDRPAGSKVAKEPEYLVIDTAFDGKSKKYDKLVAPQG